MFKIMSLWGDLFQFVISNDQLNTWHQAISPQDGVLLRSFRLYGHRSARTVDAHGRVMENTADMLRFALKCPTLSGVECDVAKTTDNQLVIVHDPTLLGLQTKKMVWELPFSSLCATAYPFLKLDQYLGIFAVHVRTQLALNNIPKTLNIELKGEGLVQDVLTVLHTYSDLHPYIVFSSFNQNNVKEIIEKSTFPVGILVPSSQHLPFETNDLAFGIQTYAQFSTRVSSLNLWDGLLQDDHVCDALLGSSIPTILLYASLKRTPKLEDTIHNPNVGLAYAKKLPGKKLGFFIDRPDCYEVGPVAKR